MEERILSGEMKQKKKELRKEVKALRASHTDEEIHQMSLRVLEQVVNLPEYVPTIPRDEYYEQISVQNNFCANKNFPVTDSTIKMTHAIELPLLQGTTCPVTFPKDTPFLLFMPTSRVEEGFLLYI